MTTFLTAAALVFGLSACGDKSGADSTPASSDTGANSKELASSNIAIFTPKDGFSISQHTPLNKWTKFTPRLTKQLVKAGFAHGNITTKTDEDLTHQSNDVQDYVVNRLSSATASQNKHTTLIVAPVIDSNNDLRQYGDYVTTPDAQPSDGQADSGSGDASKNTTNESGAQDGSGTSTDTGGKSNDAASASASASATKRLGKALKLARKAGAHVVVLADPIDGFTPDAYVQMSTPEEVGALQAQQLASKLALDKATSNHPKAIEVLLPINPKDDSGKGGKDETGSEDMQFAKKAFAGIWGVLGPYFKEGKAVSPSGLITKETTENSWGQLTFEAGKTSEIRDTLDKRLTAGEDNATPRHIDGIIAMNDFVSSGVVDELTNLKYTGSSADINPEITVSGIVGTITGKQDIDRLAVPAPKGNTDTNDGGESTDGSAGSESGKQPNKVDMAWPIITGYGAYLDMIPHIVDGKQWMTGMEDSQALCEDIAKITSRMSLGKTFTDYTFVKKQGAQDSSAPFISEGLIPISADNLKAQLIEPGYISMADAGL
ncbi:hypothetical protein [Bifidobacterium sp. ESL0790]|uniref:hypothetical protein n=1 Tax=Bifidobacterium sp. ESL0790 TaxID=2983233 RepID=UPI0023F86F2F|nr:hypothetical protein [Bifidobacterium sp. ESL0790]WEV71757.1 hypothetical protein OZY47_04645 [Bifidobacterium sp. ESL0790]